MVVRYIAASATWMSRCAWKPGFGSPATMGKRRFLPDERCLGGALELNATYNNYLRKLDDRKQQVVIRNESGPTAEQLSQQRARRIAESDHTQLNHQRNIHHLCRRMQEAYTTIERRKDPYDTTMISQPVHHVLRPNSATLSLCPWLPTPLQSRSSNRRPCTVPEPLGRSYRAHSISNPEHLEDWQQLKLKPVLEPPVRVMPLPPSRYYPGPNLLPSVQHKLYKASIMAEILDRTLYRPRDIRTLCGDFIASSPVQHRELVRAVAAEVLQELDIHQQQTALPGGSVV